MTKSHDECRKSICILCFTKAKELRTVSNLQYFLIKKYVYNIISLDERFPNVICGNCRLLLQKCYKNNNSEGLKSIQLFNYNAVAFERSTRSSFLNNCKCIVCNIAKKSGLGSNKANKKCGRPSNIKNGNSNEN